mgnify:CR=1 FL=1|jgi:hypothetical protein
MDFAEKLDPQGIWAHLPGADLIRKGLNDLGRGEMSAESLLIEISASKFRQLGFAGEFPLRRLPEHELFLRLTAADPARAHSRYNALLRRLASFHHAVRCAG